MSFLVSAHELARLLEAGGTRVLDVQFALGGPPSIELYAAGHIPGAPHLPLEPALAGPAGERGRHPLPDPEVLQEHLRRCGVDDDSSIVVYDQQTSLAAGRAWWILRWAGLTDVRVLDGGLAAWAAAGFPVASASPAPMATDQADATQGLGGAERRGTVTVRPGSLPVLELADVPRVAADGILVDVRAPERYRGEVEPIDPVAGHIPGAVNLPMGLMQHGTAPSDHRTRSAVWRPRQDRRVHRGGDVVRLGRHRLPDGPGARDCRARRHALHRVVERVDHRP